MIRKISGKTKSPSYTHLNHPVAETKSTTKFDIAETLGETFLNNSSSRNYSEKFQKVKNEQEKIKLNFKSTNTEEYNNLFNFDELLEAINQSHDSATGPDEIHYQMLKHLPESSLQALLSIFNNIWTTGDFPEDWRLATVIPIPEPGKDPAEPTNYRPIALTSCLCKTLERMINKRLIWYLESNNLLTRYQSGFRAGRSTNDNLVRLETFIRDAFIKKEHVVAVFFDLEKAYDTTWRYGIMKDIHKLGLRGRLPTFIESFLADRTMQVRVGSTLSDLYDQEQGVPQGGVLSTTLFNIKINDIVNCLDNLTDCSLYVDDFYPPTKSEGYSFGVIRPSIPSVLPSVHPFCLSGTISQYLLVRFDSFLVQMISTINSRYPISLVKIDPLTLELLPLFKYRQL